MRLFALALSVLVIGACAEPRATDPIQRGRQVFQEKNCGSCHRSNVSGGTTGPDLTHIGTISEARKPGVSAQDYVTESIRDPGAYLVPGYPDTMPRGLDRGMTREDFDDLVEYLISLR